MPTLQRCRSPDNGWEAFFVMKRQVKRLHDGKVQPCWGRGLGWGDGSYLGEQQPSASFTSSPPMDDGESTAPEVPWSGL